MDMTKGRLLSGRILVLPDEPVEKSKGGIIMPDIVRANAKPSKGRVIAVAKEPHRYENGVAFPSEVKVGDHILYGRYAGNDYLDDDTGKDYKIMFAHLDVFMVLPE